MPLFSMSSREEPASEEERAAIAVLAGYERRLARARELYVELVGRGDRIHSEIQAMQAARGVTALASTRSMGGMAVAVLASTRDSAAELPYSKTVAGWIPKAGLVIRAAPPGAGASAAELAEASSSAGPTVLSWVFTAAVQRRASSVVRPGSRSRSGDHGKAVGGACGKAVGGACGDGGGEAVGGAYVGGAAADASYLRLPCAA